MAFRITAVALGERQAVLTVAIGGELHRLAVTPAGSVLVPAALARHPMRQAIEADARELAAAAWIGRASSGATMAAAE